MVSSILPWDSSLFSLIAEFSGLPLPILSMVVAETFIVGLTRLLVHGFFIVVPYITVTIDI